MALSRIGIASFQGEAVIPFKNYIEECWEQLAIFTLNPANGDRLLEKYQHKYFIDTDVEDHESEIRRVVSVECVVGRRAGRGIPGMESQCFVRCMLVNLDGQNYTVEEDFADYAIPSLHLMIAACPKP